jgi:1-deoxy-D-xylulose-5-phosphate reductoisomerase
VPERRNIAILGSTGSIGCNAVEVVEHLGAPYRIVALSAHTNTELLLDQLKRVHPSHIAVSSARSSGEALRVTAETRVRTTLHVGPTGLREIASSDDVDVVVAAIVGFAGLEPVIAAVEKGKTVALANKESLVVAGSILIPLARETGAKIIPIDSEHSAVFQAMMCGRLSEVEKVILTASGGPFRDWSIEKMQGATPRDALNHPTWNMGQKVTIDSATMFNKALEIIEACWLFDLPPQKIQVVVHPESIVHSMVEFIDGSTIAQLSPPDMRTPIQFALTYPERRGGIGRRMNWNDVASLNFSPPDLEKFPALKLAYEVAERRGTYGAVLNAANEIAVAAFLAGSISFGMICPTVERTIAKHRPTDEPTLNDLREADRWARQTAESVIKTS